MKTHSKPLVAIRQSKAASLVACLAICASISLIILVPVQAQDLSQPAKANLPDSASPFRGKSATFLHPQIWGCPNKIPGLMAPAELRDRACFYAGKLLSPSSAAHAIFSSGFSEWRNSPRLLHPDSDDLGRRFSIFYERKSARTAGEFLAGYLHHEDFRPHVSAKSGYFDRSRAALLSVVAAPDDSGGQRLAIAPIAGALGSGFVGAASFPNRGLFGEGLRRSGSAYGCYFGSALFREFKPDLLAFANRALKRAK